jgi:protein-S-isoprenylcysteine O-methyltransferase Ste14
LPPEAIGGCPRDRPVVGCGGVLLLKTVVHTIIVPGALLVAVPWMLLGSDLEVGAAGLRHLAALGVLGIAAGGAIVLWCTWDFAVAGRGTPNPLAPPVFLVSRGLYRWMRNPMYLGVCLILLGESVVFGSLTLLLYAALVWSLLHLKVVWYEEPHLRRLFGTPYQEFCRRVPRWLPRRRRGLGQGA